MIHDIVENEVYFDNKWMSEHSITEDNFYGDIDWETVDDNEIPYKEQYNELVWAEGTRRWNEIPETDRTERMKKRRLKLERYAGMLSEEDLLEMVNAATSDDAMTERLARDLQYDEDWISASGLSQRELLNHTENNGSSTKPKERFYPEVWKSATERWEGMNEQAKTAMRATAEAEVRLTDEDVEKTDFIVAAVFATFYSILMPFLYLGCTISAVVLAFKSGSGLA